MPEIYEDAVIFTAPSSRRVGIAFAEDGFSKVNWFQKLMVSRLVEIQDEKNRNKPPPVLYQDSGILFYVYPIPENTREVEYRLIIDGLWTTDPLNPQRRLDPRTGMVHSLVRVPNITRTPSVYDAPPGSLNLTYNGPPGEIITVAGSFNRWDPFMYEMREVRPGVYSLTLPLPPGVYQYVFIHRGERIPDPHNPSKVYTREGSIASEAVVR